MPKNTISKLTRQEVVCAAILATVQFIVLMDAISMMPLGPFMTSSLGISQVQYSLLVASSSISAFISGLVLSYWINKFNKKTILMALLTGFCIGELFCSLSVSYTQLAASRFMVGFFSGVTLGVVNSAAAEIFTPDKRGRAQGIISLGFSFSTIMGVPMALLIASSFGWKFTFATSGAIALAILALVFVKLPSVNVEHQKTKILTLYKEVFSQKRYISLMAFMLLSIYSVMIIFPFYPIYIVGNNGIPQESLFILYFVGGSVSSFTVLAFGHIADRKGKVFAFALSSILSIPMIILVTSVTMSSLVGWIVAFTMTMALLSPRTGPLIAIVSNNVESKYRGFFLAVNSSAQQLIIALSTITGAYFAGASGRGIEPLDHFYVTGIVSSVLIVVSVIYSTRFRKEYL